MTSDVTGRVDTADRLDARRAVVLVLGTAFAVVTGLLAFQVSLRTFELVGVPMGSLAVLVLASFGAFVSSLYTSMCLRVELDLGVVLPAAGLGAAVSALAPYPTAGLQGLLATLFASSLANSALSTRVEERFRGAGERFIAAVHHGQSALLVGAIAWSFPDMTVRGALAVFGLIVWIGWHPTFLGGCALTLVEAKLDVARTKPELEERGFILCELEKWTGIRLDAPSFDRFTRRAALVFYAYWAVDLVVR